LQKEDKEAEKQQLEALKGGCAIEVGGWETSVRTQAPSSTVFMGKEAQSEGCLPEASSRTARSRQDIQAIIRGISSNKKPAIPDPPTGIEAPIPPNVAASMATQLMTENRSQVQGSIELLPNLNTREGRLEEREVERETVMLSANPPRQRSRFLKNTAPDSNQKQNAGSPGTKTKLTNRSFCQGDRGELRQPTNLREREPYESTPGEKIQMGTVQTTSEKAPSDGVFFAQYKGHPETLVVYRSPEERAANPERLNLDRRHLTACPILKNEERIRLLNYQNNYIEEIQYLNHLPNLIFLDLYNNCIEHLSHNLECVPTLRVLMLGKNRIKMITHLEKLVKLDVLDLHSNAIAKVEHLGALSDLRVLNLAGNRLTALDELGELQSLTELNVRRNLITKVDSLHKLQSLQRIFLSNNRIQSFDAVASLFDVRFLMELSMDGNPLVLKEPNVYRRLAIERIKTLRHLDLKRVTDAERRAFALESQKEDERRRAAEKHEMLQLERRKLQAERYEAIRAAQRHWMDLSFGKIQNGQKPYGVPQGSQSRNDLTEKRPSSDYRSAQTFDGTYLQTLYDNDGLASDQLPAKHSSMNDIGIQSLGTLPVMSAGCPTSTGSVRVISKETLAKRGSKQNSLAPSIGYYEIEIGGTHREERTLQLYGEAWECLESQKIIGSSTALVCRFVSVDRIVGNLCNCVCSLTKLKKATFGDNAIQTLRHVLQLASILQRIPHLTELKIESNPICSLSLLRPVLSVILPKIDCFNGINISDNDRVLHTRQLGSFCEFLERTERSNKAHVVKLRESYDREATRRVVANATSNALRAEEIRRNLDK